MYNGHLWLFPELRNVYHGAIGHSRKLRIGLIVLHVGAKIPEASVCEETQIPDFPI